MVATTFTNEINTAIHSGSLSKINETVNHAEILMNNLATPFKPYLAHIARFLLIVTFLEDAVRIMMAWKHQTDFLTLYRSLNFYFANLFLLYNVVMMIGGSIVVLLSRRKTIWACIALGSVVLNQTLGYGLYSHLIFMLRNASMTGALLLLAAESMNYEKKYNSRNAFVFTGLPNFTQMTQKASYASLAGRVLLVLLFLALALSGNGFHLGRLSFILISFISSVMVMFGFKAKYSAAFLIAVLSICNIVMNQWWIYKPGSPEYDFLRYDFFQFTSIMGGFLLLANMGPGELSYDEKRK